VTRSSRRTDNAPTSLVVSLVSSSRLPPGRPKAAALINQFACTCDAKRRVHAN
jgi:hypothetical protein